MYVYLAVALLSAALSFGGAWKAQSWRYAEKDRDRLVAQMLTEKVERKTVDKAAEGHEKDKVQIRAVTKTITREVERIVREPFYVDAPACFDDAGLRQLANAAAGRAHVASEPSGKVP
jgi:hypothetical protein